MKRLFFLVNCYLFLALLFLKNCQSKLETSSNHKPSERNLKELAKELENNFLNLSNPIKTKRKGQFQLMPPKLDIIFALDASRGSSKDIFEYQKNLTKVLIDSFSISPSNARVAIVSCSSNYVHFNFFLDAHVNKECLVGFIPTLRYLKQERALGKCLQSIYWQAFVKRHAIRKEANKVLFIISAGKSSDMTSSASYVKKLERRGVKIYGLSIGADKNGYKQVQGIVSRPIREHLFHVPNLVDIPTIIKLLSGKGYYSSSCKNDGKPLYDECGRLCQCQNGHVTNCTRIRKFYSTMSVQERFLFIFAFRIITTRPQFKRQFKEYANSYRNYFSRYIHTRRYFLPWHRAFLLKVENLLRSVDCRITLPYWDWTLISKFPRPSTANIVWESLRGFGGNGVGKDMCVENGPFGKEKWNFEGKDVSKECLKRNFAKNTKLPDALIIRLALNTSTEDFKEFEFILRLGFHHSVTCAIGGTMCSKDNIWSPEYLIIASFIDSLWGKWQDKERGRWPTGFQDISDILPGFSMYTGEVLQLKKQPGCVRVMYDEPNSEALQKIEDLWGDIRNKTNSQSRHIQRGPLIYSKRAEELYGGLTEEERSHLSNLPS
ncbi:uncharacterized protein LOC116295280 [Actinia tenebrosa]|uniref:Uncharacterized protein LOC116295280 n=1 Tax=Actinia tenebrosa TaxID=6105 RepID=A0A6P8I208_ACTTE|nr:uncharacterized protein LOC116295280 [Actinia tenebrosa]